MTVKLALGTFDLTVFVDAAEEAAALAEAFTKTAAVLRDYAAQPVAPAEAAGGSA